MESFSEAWNVICDYCKTKITDIAYKTWISRIEPVDLNFEKGEAILLAPNDFHRQTLLRCYKKLLNEAFEAVFGASFEIRFTIPNENKKDEENDKKEALLDADYEYTFDTFIVGSSNKFAHAAALAVATNPAGAYNPLFLYGNSGLGKTHLLHAIGNDIKKNNKDMVIRYVQGDSFTNELIEAIHLAKTPEFRQKYRNIDVLLMDDIQFIGGKESTQEEFFHTFESLFLDKKQIVLTSDRPPKEIKTLEVRLRSRFESGLLADIQPPDLETRIAIIKRKAELLHINISDDVCLYIATKIKSNIRQLEGVVKKLKARSLLDEKPSISSVKNVIADIINNEVPPEMTVEKIIEEIARNYSISEDDIRSQRSRKANIKNARNIAIYITREMTSLSMVQIGEEFGGRHYSTIVYTIQQMEEQLKNNPTLKETVNDIIKNIKNR